MIIENKGPVNRRIIKKSTSKPFILIYIGDRMKPSQTGDVFQGDRSYEKQ